MLIRWAVADDKPAWVRLAEDVSSIFGAPDMGQSRSFLEYMDSKISKYEALAAVDRMSGDCLGVIGFSRAYNRISWLAVFENRRGKGIGTRLLNTSLRQLDTEKEITVTTFRDGFAPGAAARALYRKFGFSDKELVMHEGQERSLMARPPMGGKEKRGSSFHYRYPEFIREAQEEFCPACNGVPCPEGQDEIIRLNNCYIMAEYPGQARLFGKIYVMPVSHAFHFEDMDETEMRQFMEAVQKAGSALRKVTGAVKINYEMHANSGAHLHIHLFPRYLDDEFPGAPIDYRLTDSPYESKEEYLWFVSGLRETLLEKQ